MRAVGSRHHRCRTDLGLCRRHKFAGGLQQDTNVQPEGRCSGLGTRHAASQRSWIANSIPQTATITRSAAKLSVSFDGAPVFQPVQGTNLTYAVNTSTPVIYVPSTAYYAVNNGVWFTSAAAVGPWAVATSIPPAIYTIPPSSPIHYVTYVQVYGYTPSVVYVGYTPGYYGTVLSSDGVVVYGTGYYYQPYIGPTYWVPAPYTYGVGATFAWSTTAGWALGFGMGMAIGSWCSPWWGPVGYWGWGWGAPAWGWGGWGGAAAANVYGRWGEYCVRWDPRRVGESVDG